MERAESGGSQVSWEPDDSWQPEARTDVPATAPPPSNDADSSTNDGWSSHAGFSADAGHFSASGRDASGAMAFPFREDRQVDHEPEVTAPRRPGASRWITVVIFGLGTAGLGLAWWGAMGAEPAFFFSTPFPMTDFLVLVALTTGWLCLVWRALTAR